MSRTKTPAPEGSRGRATKSGAKKAASDQRGKSFTFWANGDETSAILGHCTRLGMTESAYLRRGGVQGWIRRIDVGLDLDQALQRIQRTLDQLTAVGAPAEMVADLQGAIASVRAVQERL